MSVGVIVLLVVLAGAVAWVAWTYNRLVARRLACESSWSQIDVALRLRHDLVPRLAEAVRGYASHERATFEGVSEARSRAVAADGASPKERGAAEAALAGGIGSTMLVAESYPDLLASDNFMQLQQELAGVEEKISITRRVYNDTVETYNTSVQVFPSVLVAGAFGFRRREFFDAPVESEVAPPVSMDGGS